LFESDLRLILESIQKNEVSVEQALEQFKHLPYESLDQFANLDHHRTLRKGFPEVIYGEGKPPDQLAKIFLQLAGRNPRVMATRVSPETYQNIRDQLPGAVYLPRPRVMYLDKEPQRCKKEGVVVVTAGTVDIPVAEEAAITADLMGSQVECIFDVGVAGLHRLLDRLPILQKARVIVAVAGMEGALPSVISGLVAAPVIAVPTSAGYGASFGGLAALLAMLNSCANGVAVVNIDNGFGAGYMAGTINRIATGGEAE